MPGFDGTGPAGAGPMTGGVRGYCNPAFAGYRPGFFRGYGYGRGLGFRRGWGPGMGWDRGYGRGSGWYPPADGSAYPMSPADELDMLKAEAEAVKGSLGAIHKRIEQLEKKTAE